MSTNYESLRVSYELQLNSISQLLKDLYKVESQNADRIYERFEENKKFLGLPKTEYFQTGQSQDTLIQQKFSIRDKGMEHRMSYATGISCQTP